MVPMLATRGESIPTGADWLHEVKWDGYRVLVEVNDGAMRVTSRTERDVTVAFPEFEALTALPSGVVLDGEVVVFEEGRPAIGTVGERFRVQSRQRALKLAERSPATLVAFDLVTCLGESVSERPLVERRQLLEALPLDETGIARISPTYDDGAALMQAARGQGLEGIVSKQKQSIYRPGLRSADWLKFPLRTVASFVIGGYRMERGGARIGSLLVGEPSGAGLAYRGRVTLAVPARAERAMAEQLRQGHAANAPFQNVPEEDARDAVWVAPTTVIDVEFLLRTSEGRLRHATLVSQRADLTPTDLASS